jgi:hypothetical protein
MTGANLNSVILKYQSGQDIRRGDRVRFHREPAEVEFVATDSNDPETGWYVQEFGEGVMIREVNNPNPTFIRSDQIGDCEDLEFVARAESP